LPHSAAGYTQKLLWWRAGFFWRDTPEPSLWVSGRRLDGPSLPLHVSPATGVFADEVQSAIMVGADFPALGCWQVTGHLAGQDLSVVVWLAP
jgi:hypothetical protein